MVVYVGLTGVLMARVLVRLVAVGQGRMVVLVLVIGGQMRPVLATAEVMGYVGVLVVVDLGIVAVLLTPWPNTPLPRFIRSIRCSVGDVAVITLSLGSEWLRGWPGRVLTGVGFAAALPGTGRGLVRFGAVA